MSGRSSPFTVDMDASPASAAWSATPPATNEHTVWHAPSGGQDQGVVEAALHELAALLGRQAARRQAQRRSRGFGLLQGALLLGATAVLLALTLIFLS